MNTRRHELEKNELADRLGTGVSAVQPALPFILGGIAVLVVGSLGWGLYSSSAKKKQAVAWTEYYFTISERDGDSFLDLADEYPNSKAAGWARQTAGASYLDEGIEAIYRNKDEGVGLLKQAIEAFNGVLDASPSEELRGKALLGLARAHETLAEVDEALGFYQDFSASSAATGRLQIMANERIQFLRSDAGKEFYAWFAEQDPKPDAAIELPSGLDSPPTFDGSPLNFDSTSEGSAPSSGAPVAPATEIDTENLPDLPNMAAEPGENPVTNIDDIKLPESSDTGEADQGESSSEEPTNASDLEGDENTKND